MADLSPGAGEAVVGFLNNPLVRGLAMTVLVIRLVDGPESAPGHGLAEALAVLSLAVLIGVPLLTGYAQWWQVLGDPDRARAAGVRDLRLPPATASRPSLGGALILGGLLMTFVGPGDGSPGYLPQTPQGWTNLEHGAGILGGSLALAVIGVTLLRPAPAAAAVLQPADPHDRQRQRPAAAALGRDPPGERLARRRHRRRGP